MIRQPHCIRLRAVRVANCGGVKILGDSNRSKVIVTEQNHINLWTLKVDFCHDTVDLIGLRG